jgi:hypothetical protein
MVRGPDGTRNQEMYAGECQQQITRPDWRKMNHETEEHSDRSRRGPKPRMTLLSKTSNRLPDEIGPEIRAEELGWRRPPANCYSARSSYRKSNPSCRRRKSPISKHVNGLEKSRNMITGPKGPRTHECLYWWIQHQITAVHCPVRTGEVVENRKRWARKQQRESSLMEAAAKQCGREDRTKCEDWWSAAIICS